MTGGRFNRTGLPALYTALRFETAWLEAQQAFPFKAQPMRLCAYAVDCDDVLDLTDMATRSARGASSTDLACSWKDLSTRGENPPSWVLANRLIAGGCSGVVVPSFASGAATADVDVVFWSWGARRPHQVRVIDDHGRLPRTGASWTS